jgi:TP901 family phage tail tape measure protein
MSLTLGQLVAYIDVDDKDFNSKLDKGEKKFSKFGGALASAAKAAAVAGVAAVGAFAVQSVRNFSQFETGMNEVFTLLPGSSKHAMEAMSRDVLAFSDRMGVTTKQVVPALYQAISAGVPRENVFSFMEVAQKAAVGGVSDLKTAVDGITSVVNNYGADVMSAKQASDLMFTTVRLGKTDFGQLSASIGNVLPFAAAAGVGFEDVSAAMAVMAAKTGKTAESSTQLRALMVELSKSGTKTSNMFKELAGQTFQEFVAGGGNVQGALQLLEKHAQDTGIGVNDLFGSVEAGAAALLLTGSNTESFTDALGEMQNAAGATDAAYEQMNQGLSRSWEQIKVAVENATIRFGQQLAPAVRQLADLAGEHLPAMLAAAGAALTAVIGILISIGTTLADVNGWLQEHQTVAAVALALVVAALTAWGVAATINAAKNVVAWVTTATAAQAAGAKHTLTTGQMVVRWAFLGAQSLLHAAKVAAAWLIAMGPIALVIAAVIGLVVLIVKNWDTIRSKTVELWNAVKAATSAAWAAIKGVFTGALGAIKAAVTMYFTAYRTVITAVVSAIQAVVTGAFNAVRSAVSAALGALAGIASGAMGAMKGAVSSGVAGVLGFFSAMPGRIVGALGNLGGLLAGAGRAVIDGFLSGITGAFGKVRDTLGKLTSMLPDWKGPAERDRVLLREAGQLIMGGLDDGLQSKFGTIKSTLGDVTDLMGMQVGGPGYVQNRLGISPPTTPVRREVVVVRGETNDELARAIADRMDIKRRDAATVAGLSGLTVSG